jgi:nitroimidazol reductase NimA-like FMN-containing flavoprotein (pyridoxamine 5'-phosphate oxidase superfamily)
MTDYAADILADEECWMYLASVAVGRIAIATDDGIDIFPVNFTTHDRAIYFRSAPGSKLMKLTEQPEVSFEADGTGRTRRWSVVIKGTAERLNDDDEIVRSGVAALETVSPSVKNNFVRITPRAVSGRLLLRAE